MSFSCARRAEPAIRKMDREEVARRVYDLAQSHESIALPVKEALAVMESCLARYGYVSPSPWFSSHRSCSPNHSTEGVSLSFSGGKDCKWTVHSRAPPWPTSFRRHGALAFVYRRPRSSKRPRRSDPTHPSSLHSRALPFSRDGRFRGTGGRGLWIGPLHLRSPVQWYLSGGKYFSWISNAFGRR